MWIQGKAVRRKGHFVSDLFLGGNFNNWTSATLKDDVVNLLCSQFHAAVLRAVLGVDPGWLDTSWTQTLPQSPSHVFSAALAGPFAVPHPLPVPLLCFMVARLRLLFRRRHGPLQESFRFQVNCVATLLTTLSLLLLKETFFSVFFSRLLTCFTFTAFFLRDSS